MPVTAVMCCGNPAQPPKRPDIDHNKPVGDGNKLMFVPLHDNTTLRMIRFQFVTGAIIVINIAVFLLMVYGNLGQTHLQIATALGLVPAEMGRIGNPAGAAAVTGVLAQIPEPLTLITYTFIHGGWLHLLSNMAFMWVFADNVEDAYGHIGFLLLYFRVWHHCSGCPHRRQPGFDSAAGGSVGCGIRGSGCLPRALSEGPHMGIAVHEIAAAHFRLLGAGRLGRLPGSVDVPRRRQERGSGGLVGPHRWLCRRFHHHLPFSGGRWVQGWHEPHAAIARGKIGTRGRNWP
jgi:hypothetical protein